MPGRAGSRRNTLAPRRGSKWDRPQWGLHERIYAKRTRRSIWCDTLPTGWSSPRSRGDTSKKTRIPTVSAALFKRGKTRRQPLGPGHDCIHEMRCPVTSGCSSAIGQNEIKPSAATGMGPTKWRISDRARQRPKTARYHAEVKLTTRNRQTHLKGRNKHRVSKQT